MTNWILKLIGDLRVQIIKLAGTDHFETMLAHRKGKCLKCGQCCFGCKYLALPKLNEETGEIERKCTIYKNRSKINKDCICRFPLDKADLWFNGIHKCGYYWQTNKQHKRGVESDNCSRY